MNERLVEYRADRGVATLELTSPPANTYSYEMMRELDDAILRARFDPAVHVLVLRGAGERFFCAGADIKMLSESDPRFKYFFCLHANETLNRLEQTPKLVIAAINGHAVGGGLEIALAADIRVAREGAGKVGLPEINLGVLPGTGGTQRLARTLGKSRALRMMVTGETLSVEAAVQAGLIDHVWEDAEFEHRLDAFARGFLPPSRASKAVGLIKRSVQSGLEAGFHEGLAIERELQQQLFESEDAREGLAAYLERRDAEFKGR